MTATVTKIKILKYIKRKIHQVMMEKHTMSFKLAFFAFFLQTNRRSYRSE